MRIGPRDSTPLSPEHGCGLLNSCCFLFYDFIDAILRPWMHERSALLTLLYSGGEEVLLDVGGQDGSEAFEDVGHSDEAREILDGLLVGSVKRLVRYFCQFYTGNPLIDLFSARRPRPQGPRLHQLLVRLLFLFLRRLRCRPLRRHPHRWCHRLRCLQLPPGPAAGPVNSLYPGLGCAMWW